MLRQKAYDFKCLEGEDLSFDDLKLFSYCYGYQNIPFDPFVCTWIRCSCVDTTLISILKEYFPLRLFTNFNGNPQQVMLALQVVNLYSIIVQYLEDSPHHYSRICATSTSYTYGLSSVI